MPRSPAIETGLRISDDGQDFDVKPRVPGSFQLGVGLDAARGTRVTLRLTTPAR